MSTERKNPLKRDQALNDSTSGQLGKEPSLSPLPGTEEKTESANSRQRAARRISRQMS